MGRNESTLRQAQKTINNDNGRAASLSADLSDLAGIAKTPKPPCLFLARRILWLMRRGLIFVLPPMSPVHRRYYAGDMQETMNINLGAPFFLTRALIYNMKAKGGGAIINIGSLQSLRAGLGDAAYTASKGGVAQLTKIMARAWGKYGITANAILPGFFPTNLTRVVFEDDLLKQKLAESTLLKRNGEMADLEGAAVFLASPAAAYITGILLPVDGGFLAK